MVLVDVIVTDKRGRAVPGLMQSEFVITEDGRRQSIESYEEFQTTDVVGEINLSGASATSPTAGRFLTLVVNDIHITPHPPAILRARAAAAALVEAASEGDQIMLVSQVPQDQGQSQRPQS